MITDAACDPADKDNVKAAAVLKLESLVFIHWELKKEKDEEEETAVFFKDKMGYIVREILPFTWETHHAACEQFYQDVVIADSRTAYVEFIKELEHLDDPSVALTAVRGMTTSTLRQRAAGTIHALLDPNGTEKKAYMDRFQALPNYDVETDLFMAGATFFKTVFAADKRFFTQEDSQRMHQYCSVFHRNKRENGRNNAYASTPSTIMSSSTDLCTPSAP